jgi:transposase
MHRHELSDEQWLRISPLLPRHGRRPLQGDRSFINAVRYLMKTGCPWRDLPERYGKWKTIYNRFANWSRAGHFERIFKALRVKVDKRGSLLDATIARAHQDAAGGKGGSAVMLWDGLVEVFPPAPRGRRLSWPPALRRADAWPAA